MQIQIRPVNTLDNEGSALLESSTDTNGLLVLNCKLIYKNCIFPDKFSNTTLILKSKDETIPIKGTDVDWYGKNLINYNGAQFIIPVSMLKNLASGIKYELFIKFIIDNHTYEVPLNPNAINITTSALNIDLEITQVNQCLSFTYTKNNKGEK